MSPSASISGGLNAYATLLTRPSYLPGAILLSYTLFKHSPSTPLIILYTPETLARTSVEALQAEAHYSNCIPYPIDHLRLPRSDGHGEGHGMVAERFIDTWTKLRVFDIQEVNGKKIDRICFLDADMMIFSDPSPFVFSASNDEYLTAPEGQGHRIGATHVCVCNLDKDSWAPSTWNKENCAYTHLAGPDAIAPVDPTSDTKGIFNSGTFVFRPSPSMQAFVRDAFQNTPVKDLKRMKFHDQDFLNMVFQGRWTSLCWRVNALKTWRYWHPNMWVDDQVAALHYIVDKPWVTSVQISNDGQHQKIAGYKGDDGETHSWWYGEYGQWKTKREDDINLTSTVASYTMGEHGNEEMDDDMKAIRGGPQDFAKKWKDGKEIGSGTTDVEDNNKQPEQDPHGSIVRTRGLGERGHGPVVRNPDLVRQQQQLEGQPKKINPMGRSYMEP